MSASLLLYLFVARRILGDATGRMLVCLLGLPPVGSWNHRLGGKKALIRRTAWRGQHFSCQTAARYSRASLPGAAGY